MKQLFFMLACVGASTSVFAEIGPPTTIAARTQGAGRVVVATVLDVQSRFATNQFGDQLILSDLVLEVAETLKGPAVPTVDLTVEGGTVGDLTLKVSDLPSFKPGDRGLFFLDAGANGRLRPHDRGRGLLKVSPAGLIEGSSVTLDTVRQEVLAALGRASDASLHLQSPSHHRPARRLRRRLHLQHLRQVVVLPDHGLRQPRQR